MFSYANANLPDHFLRHVRVHRRGCSLVSHTKAQNFLDYMLKTQVVIAELEGLMGGGKRKALEA